MVATMAMHVSEESPERAEVRAKALGKLSEVLLADEPRARARAHQDAAWKRERDRDAG